VHGVLRISSSSAAAWIEIVVAGVVAVGVLVATSAPIRARLGALSVGVLVTLLVATVYGGTVLR
jgi:hypothetical protein